MLSNKIVSVLLMATVTIPTVVYGGFKAVDYRQTQIVLQEAKQLSSSGKYQEAVTKLVEADGKWTTNVTRKEVENLKEESKVLIQSSADYELGKELFDKDKYEDALGVLKRVDSRDINYPNARSLIELAEKKIDSLKGEVAGIKTESKKTQVVYDTLPTPIPTSATPTPTPEPQKLQHTDSYCKNEAALAVIKFDEEASRITREAMPWLFSYEAYVNQFGDFTYDDFQKYSQQTYEGIKQNAVREGQKIYHKVYNQCLGN